MILDIDRPPEDIFTKEFAKTFKEKTNLNFWQFIKAADFQHRRNTKIWKGQGFELRLHPMKVTIEKV